jgi:amidohydrolase
MARLEIEGLNERGPRRRWKAPLIILGIAALAVGFVICGRDLASSDKVEEKRAVERGSGATQTGGETYRLPRWGPQRHRSTGGEPDGERGAVRPSPYSASIWGRVEKMQPELVKLRRKLHAHPELANRESWTAKLLAGELEKLGFEVRTGVALTGVTALLKGKKPGPTVALLASMDGVAVREKNPVSYASKRRALFEGKKVWVSHAAGHDVEMAVLIGAARILSDLQDVMPGSVKLIFQPAGEGLPKGEEGGARAMVMQGVLGDPPVEALFSLVCEPTLRVGLVGMPEDRWWRGLTHFKIRVRGSGLASCLKPESAGCVDPVLVASQLVVLLQTQVPRQVAGTGGVRLTVGSVKAEAHQGRLPELVVLRGTLRWKRSQDARRTMTFIRRSAKGTALSSNARIQVTFSQGKRMVPSDPKLVRWILPSARRMLGRRGVVFGSAGLASESFAPFRRHVPAVLMQLGTHSKKLETRRKLRTSRFNVDEESISVGVHFLSNLALDYLLDHAKKSPPASAEPPPSQ